jgi:hypothetical protein
MENLGRVAYATGGDVDIVDPLEISANFDNLVKSTVIATNGK